MSPPSARVGCLSGLMLALGLCGQSVQGQGWFTGDAGGYERDVVLFDRNRGMVWSTMTGPDGRFHSPPVPAGTYMALSQGRVTPMEIRDGQRTEILWASRHGYEADTETWSPARRKFGQTFVAFAEWVAAFNLWNPGPPVELVAELRENGPGGRRVGRRGFQGPVAWIDGMVFQPGEWPTTPGMRYYLSVESTDGKTFSLGTPALGDVDPRGEAFYDDEPMLDADMGFSILGDNDGLHTTVRVQGGLGFMREGPASGVCRWAAQGFVAATRNIITAYANAGWASEEGIVHEFVFSIHAGSPEGPQVGPSRTLRMVKDWGATAVWFPDQVGVESGRTYAMRFARADGEPFYAYLAEDTYTGGDAIRQGLETPGMDLTCEIRGERTPGAVFFPTNVALVHLRQREARVTWETPVPTAGAVELALEREPRRVVSSDDGFRTRHTVTIPGLRPATTYRYVAGGVADAPGAAEIRSKVLHFTTLPDPTAPPAPRGDEPVPAGAREVRLVNPGFENGLKGWTASRAPREGHPTPLPASVGQVRARTDLRRFEPRSGRFAAGWHHRIGPGSGEIPRKLEPALAQVVWQTVRVTPGKRHVLSAWILTEERGGGWNRNDRVRLCVDPTGAKCLSDPRTVDSRYVTQWYTTRGEWRRFRLRFLPLAEEIQIGFELYQWWMLEENNLFVDDVHVLRVER